MKVLTLFLTALILVCSVHGQGQTSVTRDPNQFWQMILNSLRNMGASGTTGRSSFQIIFDSNGVRTSINSNDIMGYPSNQGNAGNNNNRQPPPPPPAEPSYKQTSPPSRRTVRKRKRGPEIAPGTGTNYVVEGSCTPEYKSLSGHTMCMRDDARVRAGGVSEADKIMITDLHNDYRSRVEPPATDLVKLVWDERLAAVAQKWANQCKAGHDKQRKIPSIGMSIGQNVAGGYRSWEEAIFHWYDEIRMWRYGVDPDSYLGSGGWKKIGHFTQMVQNGTFLVGCGYADCGRSKYTRYYVCDYSAGQSNLAYPYTAAKSGVGRCSACPNTCNNGQCDCNGLVCLNKGKLDPNTCTCTCTKLYEGNSCEILKCPAEDKWICGRDWRKSYCKRFYNVPEECPYMCGICKSANGNKPIAEEVTYISDAGCRYNGRRSTLDECKAYGDGGQDIFACATNGGNITCGDCDKFYNVKRDMCPVMCGMCDPQCGGKTCRNGGTLNTYSCECSCIPPYTGDMCETVDCSVPDKRHCRFWPRSHCSKYINVPDDCRRKCGLCR